MQFSRRYLETLNGVEHEILLEEDAPGSSRRRARSRMPGIATTI